MVLQKANIVHVITRRGFKDDIARHFVGQVLECHGSVARIQGFSFVLDNMSRKFMRRKRERTRLVSLVDGGIIVTVLSNDTRLEEVRYQDVEGHLMLVDGGDLKLDFSEYRLS